MIYLYNTLTRTKEKFTPLKEGVVSMYHCGPTVYDYAHIGNLRAYVFADILRRTFEYNGYEVKQVMNITDVDDKTIKRAREEGVPLSELTRHYEEAFLADMDALSIKRPHEMPRATAHIDEMVMLIKKLLEKGIAYRGDDNSVYFDISKDPRYGELVGLEKQNLKTEARVSADEYSKEEARDFVLWKAWKPEDNEVFWETSLGKGRPGWHIECSAMSMRYLGERFDIHTGGIDLIFPHHTNEIAQSQGATGHQFARFWLHNEFITVDDQKMAKSLGNILTLENIISRIGPRGPMPYRYWLLTAHYRSLINFTWEALKGAQSALEKLYDYYLDLGEEVGEVHDEYRARFRDVINDDLNTPQALALAWELVKDADVNGEEKKATLLDFDRVLGLGLSEQHVKPIPLEILDLATKREEARAEENWQKADELRNELQKQGYIVDDTPDGPKVKKKQN